MGPIDLECSELVLQSWSIKSVFRNTNCIINQVFKQIKVKQKDPIPNSNVSNENEATQTSNQITAENIHSKHLLMISYQREKGEQVYKSARKTIKNSSSVSFAGNKLRWWLHDPGLPGWNFNPSSRGIFHPTITCGN